MAVNRNSLLGFVLLGALLCLASLPGCRTGGDSPTGPVLGEEIDLSLYSPPTLEGYDAVFRTTQGDRVGEARTWCRGTETINELDPETGVQTPVQCAVLQRNADGVLETRNRRTYLDEGHIYALKIYGVSWQETWEPLLSFNPKVLRRPEENPRVNSTFDSGGSTLIINDGYTRRVSSVRTVTTYLGIEDNVTVPAGTFDNVLRTRIREIEYYKATDAGDTTNVLDRRTIESTIHLWDAAGVGTIKTTGGIGPMVFEKELVSGTINGVSYP